MTVTESLAALLRPLTTRPDASGVLTDFDGTLAPIVADPAAARPAAGAVEMLHALSRRYRRVAVVSGRPAAFLVRQLRLADQDAGDGEVHEGVIAAGLYGMEMADGEQVTCHPSAQEWRSVVTGVADLAEEEAPPGVLVERKGLSATLHYRTVPDAQDWCETWAAAQAGRTGLVVHPARKSVELLPPLPIDKGSVVAQLAAGLAAVCFIGDDRGDLAGFRALDDLAESDGTTAVKVAVRSTEAPAELLARADVVVEGTDGAVEVLRGLLEAG